MQQSALIDVWTSGDTHWWYRVRRELLKDMLAKVAPNNARLLDVGCATGDTLVSLQSAYNVSGVERSKEAVEVARARGLNVTYTELPTLALADSSVDVVTILDVLEHIDDDTAMLREIERVLVPGGICIIFVPAFMFLWSITDERSEHKRRYTASSLRAVIGTSTLAIERVSYFNFLLFPAIACVRLLNRIGALQDESEMGGGYSRFNTLLYKIFSLERHALPLINFPWGVSLFALVRKQKV